MRVLVVEDSVESIASFLRYLERNKIGVTHVLNLSEFLISFEADKPDFVVTDLQMPLSAGEAVDKDAGAKVLNYLHRHKFPAERTFVLTFNAGRKRIISKQKVAVYSKGYKRRLADNIIAYAKANGRLPV